MNWFSSEWHKLVIVITALTQWFIHWDEIVERLKKFSGIKTFITRHIGDRRKEAMGALGYIELISRIASEAPVLLPDAMKLLGDLNQFNADFQKLLADYQGIKTAAVVPAAKP